MGPSIAALLVLSHAASPLAGVSRIVMMGDSITQMGAQPKGYVTLVAQSLQAALPNQPIEVVNVGISGQEAPDMLARFQRDVVDRHPQIVTLSVGVNDVWHDFRDPAWTHRVPEGNSGRGVPLSTYLDDVGQMMDLATRNGIRMIFLSPTLIYEDLDCAENKRLGWYVRGVEALAKRKGVTFLNLNRVFRNVVASYQKASGKRQLLLTVDGVHMNPAGNALMADQILQTLAVPIPNGVAP